MYGFVDTQPTENAKHGLSLQTIFNQINLDEHLTDDDGSFMTLAVNGRNDFSHRINSVAVPGGDGEVEQDDPPLDSKTIIVEYKLKANSNELLREKFNQLNGLLKGSKVELRFTDEDALFYTTPRINSVPDERSNDLVGTIEFYCSDPYKYGPEQTVNFSSDTAVIENEGTAEAKPIFELTAKEPVTFAMVSNGEEYNLVGTPADDNIEIIDAKPLVLSERGETLDQWNVSHSDNLDSFLGGVGGSMGYDGTGIFPQSYGSGSGMHGPAIIRELPRSLTDFEIETTFDIISNYDRDGFRMELYMFDEGMNPLGKMGINDNSQYRNERIGLARVGEYRNDEYKSDTSYLINQYNYQKTLGRVSLMYLRVKRERGKFTFYIAEIRNGRHYETIERSYADDFGDLRYIQLFIGNWEDRPRTFRTRINYVNVYELIQQEIDQTPYFAYAGDKIVFDHENRDVLLNGEAIAKQIGGDFFTIKKGDNTLALMPEGAFEAQLRYRPRYR